MNHGDAILLCRAVGGIVPVSFLSRGAHVIPKKNIPTIASSSLGACASASLVAFSLSFVGFGPPPPSRPPSPPSKVDVPQVASLLLHQALIVQRLIVVLGPNFRVSSSPAACPNSRVVAALCDCIGLRDIIKGGFHLNLIDVPSANALFFLHLMGPPDPSPDFLLTHLVLWVAPRLFSSAPVGFIHHNNGTDFMSHYLTPLASSLPGTAPGLLAHLGGIPHGQWSVPVPSMGYSLHTSFIYDHLWEVPCTPRVSLWRVLCTPLSLKTQFSWGLVAQIQKRIFLGRTYAMGFDV